MSRKAWWVFYDGACPLCQGAIGRFGRTLRAFGGRSCSLQASPLAAHLAPNLLLAQMRVWTGRRLLGGADAVAWILGRPWFLAPLPWLAGLPLIHTFCRHAYAWVARNRYCLQGVCKIPQAPP
ncbi:MAG: DUF393 domain-containing protein [Planctomycetota bacterium]|nr:MAG: DUF393 domain-containing protein [Planctomycetota bacterium]